MRLARGCGLLLAAAVVVWLVCDVRVQQASLEGDELVHVLLTEQLAHGSYSLRGTRVLQLPGFSHYLYDRAVHYNPPLYDALLLGVRVLFTPAAYIYVSLACTAASACFVYRLTRRRASTSAAAFAVLVYLGCPIVYLVSCRIWAESLLALLVAVVADRCDALGEDTPTARELLPLCLLLTAAALVKMSILFVMPGLACLALGPLALQQRNPERVRRLAFSLLVLPALISALWLGYVLTRNQLSPPTAALIDDRMDNTFVAEQANKPPLSLLYMPLWLNPGYALALLAFTRERMREMVMLALSVLGGMLAFSAMAWLGVGTYHTKYLSCVLPLLAVLAGVGFDTLGRRLGAPLRIAVRALVALALFVLLGYENSVNRHTWIAEVSPSLYTTKPLTPR